MRVIKDKSVIDDEWSLIRKLDSSASIPEGSVILPFSFWQANRDILLKSKKTFLNAYQSLCYKNLWR